MKILMVTCGGFIKGLSGWPEYGLARELVRMGHEVTAVTSSSVGKKFKAMRHENIDGIEVFRSNPIIPFGLVDVLKKKKFDIIHAHFPGYMAPLSSYSALYKKLFDKGTPLVHTVHGIYHDPFLVKDIEDPFSHPIRREMFRKKISINPILAASWFAHLPINVADRIFALTQYEKNELASYGIEKSKIDVIPNGIDLKKFEVKTKKNMFKRKYGINGHMVLFVGQARGRKGPEYLVMSAKKVLKRFPDTTIVFVGYRMNKELEELAMREGVSDNIKFIGYVSERDKIAAYRDADVFVLPTNYEGFGIVYIEAMACGTPIVTTDTPGISEIVKPERNGLLVKPKNPDSLAKGIIRILENRNLRSAISRNNKKDANYYSWQNIARKVKTIYESLLNR